MRRRWGGLFKRRSAGCAAFCLLLASACNFGFNFPHDVTIPLTNDIPQSAIASISDTLFFPDTILDTVVSITDLNDSILTLYCLPADVDPTGDLSAWRDGCRQIATECNIKQVPLYIAGTEMGEFAGIFVFCDQQTGRCAIPYYVVKSFKETFDSLPATSPLWAYYNEADKTHTSIVGGNQSTLQLAFEMNDTSSIRGAGVRSRFGIRGDFQMSVYFKLRDDMLDGFSAAFFVSDKPDTSRWNQRAGIFLSGNGNGSEAWVTINAGVGINTTREDMDMYQGTLKIKRESEQIIFTFLPIDTNVASIVMDKNFSFTPDTVFVHLRMNVDNTYRNRHCYWDNLTIASGMIVF